MYHDDDSVEKRDRIRAANKNRTRLNRAAKAGRGQGSVGRFNAFVSRVNEARSAEPQFTPRKKPSRLLMGSTPIVPAHLNNARIANAERSNERIAAERSALFGERAASIASGTRD